MLNFEKITFFMFSLFFSLFFLLPQDFSQSFEGRIFYTKEIYSSADGRKIIDTVFTTFYIKKNIVRMDELDKTHKLLNYWLIDTKNQTVHALDPLHKRYRKMELTNSALSMPDGCEVIKSQNSKKINGYECLQWLVTNRDNNTQIAYWVANGEFNFFDEFLKIMFRSEKVSLYYLQIPESKGYFPMLTEERSLLREMRSRSYVNRIERTSLDENLFQIPKNWEYDRR